MNLSLYAGATGMEAEQMNLNTIANNIANVNTTGFKRSNTEFQDLLYHTPRSAGGETGDGNVLPTGIEFGNGVKVVSTARVHTQGKLKQTNDNLDYAIQGVGFFQIRLADGSDGYTRDGAFKAGPDGNLTTSDGLPLSQAIQIPANMTNLFVSATGEVSVETPNGTQQVGNLQLIRFTNPSGLKSMGGNILSETNASGTPEIGNPGQNGFGSIQQGFLEMSNVNVVEEMVNMITAQRAYEINSKSIQTSDEMLRAVGSLKR